MLPANAKKGQSDAVASRIGAAVSALQNAVTAELARRQGIPHTIVPMSDDPVRSLILTDEGDLAFQDYFVRRRCEPRFISIRFAGAEQARIAPGLAAALADRTLAAIVVCPSNPVLSIGPFLAVPEIAARTRARAALSGEERISGA